jgi:hypothetical protein
MTQGEVRYEVVERCNNIENLIQINHKKFSRLCCVALTSARFSVPENKRKLKVGTFLLPVGESSPPSEKRNSSKTYQLVVKFISVYALYQKKNDKWSAGKSQSSVEVVCVCVCVGVQ